MCWIFLAPLFWPYDTVSVIKNRRNSWGNNGAGAAPVPYGLDFEEGQEEAVSTRWRETKWEIRSGSPCCRGGNSQSVNTWDLASILVSSRKVCSIDVKSIGTFKTCWACCLCVALPWIHHSTELMRSRDPDAPDAPGFGKHNSWQLSGFHRGRWIRWRRFRCCAMFRIIFCGTILNSIALSSWLSWDLTLNLLNFSRLLKSCWR